MALGGKEVARRPCGHWVALSAWVLMEDRVGVGVAGGSPPGLLQERPWPEVAGERAPPTDPLLVVDAPLMVLAHHHLDAPLPIIPLQDDGLRRAG